MQLKKIPLDDVRVLSGEHFLQTPFWARFKTQFGWEAHAFSSLQERSEGESKEKGISLLYRKIGAFRIAYLPFPPFTQGEELTEFIQAIKPHLLPKTLFLRFDTPYQSKGEKRWDLRPPFRRIPSLTIQPQDTVLLDLVPPTEAILGEMHKKWRYNIRLSGKKGVIVKEGNSSDIPLWYELYRVTAQRDKISLHSQKYYQTLFDLAQKESEISLHLYLAMVEEECVAGIFVLQYGKRAVYLYGASGDAHREKMPAYALQWHAIEEMKSQGVEEYDLYGIPPNGEDKNHPMHGLYRFKTGFGGEIVHTQGIVDTPLIPLLYRGYRIVEKLRYWYYKRIKKWVIRLR